MIAITELGRVYATATDKNQLAISDANSLAVIATADGSDYPDGLTYDPEVGKIYVSHEHGGADTVVDTGPTRQSPESSVGDDVGNTYRCSPHPGGGRVKNHFVSIDPATDQVAGTTDLSGCPGAHGLAIDADRGLAFVACEGNAKFLALDLRNMQIVFTGDVGKTPDVMDLDRPQQHVYVAAESGPLTVFDYSGETVRQLS